MGTLKNEWTDRIAELEAQVERLKICLAVVTEERDAIKTNVAKLLEIEEEKLKLWEGRK